MTTILIKKKDTAGAPAPGDLTNAAGGAELAVNTFDKRLYTKDSGGNVVEIGTNPSTIDTTTVDTTNLEVTNIKAKDGTASATIADSTGVMTIASSVLTTTDINGGTVDNTAIGATTASTGKFSTLTNAALTSGRVTYAGTAGLLQDSANLTFNGTTLAAAGFSGPISGVVTSTSITDSGLTSGRVTYAGTGGLLQDDADFTFNGTTVTMANDASISGLTVGKGGGAVASNTAIGASAMAASATGTNNVGVGASSLNALTSGQNNVGVGQASLLAITTGSNNIGIGQGTIATATTASDNTGIGHQALLSTTSGTYNTAIGANALRSNTTASNNTAVGYQAGYSNTTGAENSILGYLAGNANTTGSQNTFIGRSAATTNQTGAEIVAVGFSAMGNCGTAANYNTAVGRAALNNVTGTLNVGLGNGSGSAITSGSKNTILGGYSGNTGGLDIRTASNYIVLSDGDGNPRIVTTNAGDVLIRNTTRGSQATLCPDGIVSTQPAISTFQNATSSQEQISFRNPNGVVGSITTNGSATAFNTSSDYRLKTDATTIKNALATVEALNPVSFTWIDGRKDDGFLAHEIQAVLPNCVTGEKDAINEDGTPKYQQMDSSGVIPFLVKAIQELKAEVDSLKQQLAK